jgi:cobyric acid synthase
VVVVGDIDRGGVLASLFGTLALLDAADQALVAGFLVNKFRGDPAVLAPGLDSDGGDLGCRRGAVVGVAWPGIFEGDGFRRAFLGWVAAERALDWVPGTRSFAAVREERLDALGDLIADHVDTAALDRLLEEGAPVGPPFVPPRVPV